MKTKSTVIWLVLAIALFAFIWLWQKHWQPAAPVAIRLLPGLRTADVTGVEITPAGALAISASRTNGAWLLQKPFTYPAQAAAIETLLAAMEKLTPWHMTAGDVVARKNSDADFGFENPQFRLDLTAGEQGWHLLIGNKTAPGDQVFVRVVGTDGVFVTDVNWLQFLPATVTAWRDTSLLDTAATYDWIIITNGAKVIELRRDATNRLWRMTYPLASARADSDRINTALQQLRSASVQRFVTDNPKADQAAFGLQPAELDLSFGRGTNLLDGIHVGKATTEIPTQVYARRDGWNSIFTVTNNVFNRWREGVNEFRDAHLFSLTAPVAGIEVTGINNFILQLRGSNEWQVVGEKFPVDAGLVRDYIRNLAGFRVAEFRKDATTETDLKGFGLTTPPATEQITLRPAMGDTNAVIAQLLFGNVDTNKNTILVKRADENYVYDLASSDFSQLETEGFQFRDRRIWEVSETNIAQITVRQNGKTRTVIHNGANQWALAAGSQGVVDTFALEETAHRLGDLVAVGWLKRNYAKPEELGFNTNNLAITIELKTGEKLALNFGSEVSNTALAEVTLAGEHWMFVFPPVTYFYVAKYLAIPSDTP